MDFSNTNLTKMYELLGRLEREVELPSVEWTEAEVTAEQQREGQFRAILGVTPGWRIVVSEFDIEPQGFPKGSKGYDGAGTYLHNTWPGPAVIRMTRELAAKAFKLGDAAVSKATSATSTE